MSDLLWPSLFVGAITMQLINILTLRDASRAGHWAIAAVEYALLVGNAVVIAYGARQLGIW
jgi:hypothetical protein